MERRAVGGRIPLSGHKEVVFFSDVHKHMRGLFHGVFKKVAFGAGKYIMQIWRHGFQRLVGFKSSLMGWGVGGLLSQVPLYNK